MAEAAARARPGREGRRTPSPYEPRLNVVSVCAEERLTLEPMSGQSRFADLEPLLARVSKPIQYVGGELNSHGQGLGRGRRRDRPLGPDVPRRLRGRPAQPGRHDPLRGAQRAARRPRRAHLRRVARPRGAACASTGCRSSPSTGTGRSRAFDLLGRRFSTELGYTNLLTALDLAGIPLHAADRDDADPVVIAGGHAAFNPEPIADFVDAAVLGDGEQAVLDDHRPRREPGSARGGPGGRDELLLRLARTGGVYVPGLLRRRATCRTAASSGSRPNRPGRAVAGRQAHRHGPRRVALPQAAARPARRDRPRADVGRDLPRLHPRLPVLPGRDDHPTGAGALDHRHRRDGRAGAAPPPASRRSGCSRSPRPTTPRSATIAKGLADRYEGTQTGLSLPSTRVDAFNIDLANELTRNGRRSGLTFAPEGGSERIRRVINKMVTEEDLIAHGRRGLRRRLAAGQALLHVRPAHRDRRGRPADRRGGQAGHRDRARGERPSRHPLHGVDRRLRPQAAHAVPVGRPARSRPDRRPAREAARRRSASDRRYGSLDRLPLPRRASPASSRACSPAATGGSAGSSRRYGATAAGSTAGASTSPTSAGWPRPSVRSPAFGVDVDWYTTREREESEVLPWDHLDSGLDKDWLWQDWQDVARRVRGRGLPLDPVLRLRGVPAAGHRHPDRPDRPDPAAAHRRDRCGPDLLSALTTGASSARRCRKGPRPSPAWARSRGAAAA